MALCKGTNFCTQCGTKLTDEEKGNQVLPMCIKCGIEDTNKCCGEQAELERKVLYDNQ